MAGDPDVPRKVLTQLRTICMRLPEVHEEDAWVGTRWVVRKRTFAHVLVIADGRVLRTLPASQIDEHGVLDLVMKGTAA